MDQILAVFIIVYYLYTPHLPDFLNPLSLFPSFPLSLFPSFPLSLFFSLSLSSSFSLSL